MPKVYELTLACARKLGKKHFVKRIRLKKAISFDCVSGKCDKNRRSDCLSDNCDFLKKD